MRLLLILGSLLGSGAIFVFLGGILLAFMEVSSVPLQWL